MYHKSENKKILLTRGKYTDQNQLIKTHIMKLNSKKFIVNIYGNIDKKLIICLVKYQQEFNTISFYFLLEFEFNVTRFP